jgi:hypothetical protein
LPNLNGVIPNIPNVLPTGAANPAVPSGFQNSNNDNLNRPTLGQPIPPLPIDTRPAAATARAVGNAVTFKVTAKAGATVNIYRNGILVSTVPAAAAAAIKVSDNPGGANTFQVVVVDKNGEVTASPKKTVAVQGGSSGTRATGSGSDTKSDAGSKTSGSKTSGSKTSGSKTSGSKTATSKAGK